MVKSEKDCKQSVFLPSVVLRQNRRYRMKKRLLSLLLSLCLLSGACLFPLTAKAEGLENFSAERTYVRGQFTDVSLKSTFADNVETAYELGLMQGESTAYFGVKDNLTRLEALIIACRIHSIYNTGSDTIERTYTGTTQQQYLQYAKANGIYTLFSNWSATTTRAEYALILGSALPDAALPQINTIGDGAIPDLAASTTSYSAVYRLYRAGVLTGSDSAGTFEPTEYITRGAAAAIATRMVSTALRRTLTLGTATGTQTSEKIYADCSPAVAYITVQNKAGTTYASGSGFFISSTGTFVTCYHVIDGAYSASVKTTDGATHTVAGVYDYSKTNDWAVLKVNGSGFKYLTIASSSEKVGGAVVYAIGSPLGLDNTISQGLISNVSRAESGTNYIQTTAAISSGSSGGALLSSSGHVLGITSGSYTDGQNLNMAVPMSYVAGYSSASVTTLAELEAKAAASAAVNPYATLTSYVKKEGTFDQNYNSYILTTTDNGSDGGKYVGYLAYDMDYSYLIFGYIYYDSNGGAVETQIIVPSVSSQYDVYLVSDDYGFECEGKIAASSFTQNSVFSATSYSGTQSKSEVESAAPTFLAGALVYANVLMEDSHLTIRNFGFSSMYNAISA
jgi:hypothetical protein